MKVAILGAGSLGCIFGAHLWQAGHDVTLLARGEHYQRIRDEGLTLIGLNQETRLHIPVVDRAQDLQSCDTGIVAAKSYDTNALLTSAKHLAKDRAVFFSLQNSMDKEEQLQAHLGAQRVLGAVTLEGATRLRPGVVRHTAPGHTWLGEYPAGISERVRHLVQMLNDVGLPTAAAHNIQNVKWAKLIQFSATAAASTPTRLPVHLMLQDPDAAELFLRILREGVAIMVAHGLAPADYPALPIKKLAELPHDQALQQLHRRGRELERLGYTHVQVSMLQDVLSGRPTEVEDTLGQLLTKGRQVDVATPTLETLYYAIKALARTSGKTHSIADASTGFEGLLAGKTRATPV